MKRYINKDDLTDDFNFDCGSQAKVNRMAKNEVCESSVNVQFVSHSYNFSFVTFFTVLFQLCSFSSR